MARLYSNENFPLPVVEELRKLGHDVLTIQDTGKASHRMTDEEVLEYAIQQTRAILTLNRKHFIKLHASHPGHHGMIVCTYDPLFARQAASIHNLLNQHPNLMGQLFRINRPNI